jgi:hypothetical protein
MDRPGDWLEEVHPADRAELLRIRELGKTEPAFRVIAAAESALAQLQLEGIGPEREASYMQMIFTHRVVLRLEGWGLIPLERGSVEPEMAWL